MDFSESPDFEFEHNYVSLTVTSNIEQYGTKRVAVSWQVLSTNPNDWVFGADPTHGRPLVIAKMALLNYPVNATSGWLKLTWRSTRKLYSCFATVVSSKANVSSIGSYTSMATHVSMRTMGFFNLTQWFSTRILEKGQILILEFTRGPLQVVHKFEFAHSALT